MSHNSFAQINFQRPSQWIFGAFSFDFFFLLMPGPFILLASLSPYQTPAINKLLLFICFATFDSGHVYTTFWRTWLHPQERKRLKVYFWGPIGLITFFTLYLWLGIPYLWSLVLYTTVYHYVRQIQGFYRFYGQGLPLKARWEEYLFIAMILSPFIAFHFNKWEKSFSLYSENDLFFYPSETLYQLTLILILFLQTIWICRQLYHWYHRTLNKSQTLYQLSFSWFYNGLFLSGLFSPEIILMALVTSHALPYEILITKSLIRTRPFAFMKKVKITIFIVSLTALIGGGTEFFLEAQIIDTSNSYLYSPLSFPKAFLCALYLTPLFCHFLADALIWRRKHPEFYLSLGLNSDYTTCIETYSDQHNRPQKGGYN